MNKVTISINIISFFVIKHRFKNGIILNEVNTSNKRESSQNMIEMLRSNSQDVSLSLYILRQIEDMPILHLLWLIAHLNYFFWCRSNISVLLRGGNRNNQTGRKITSRPTVIWLISWILKTIHGIKNCLARQLRPNSVMSITFLSQDESALQSCSIIHLSERISRDIW